MEKTKLSIGQEPITRDEIATVYASQKVKTLKEKRNALLESRDKLREESRTKLRKVTEDFLGNDKRYQALLQLDALLGVDVMIKYTYNLVTYENQIWTIDSDTVLEKGSLNGEYHKYTVNVVYCNQNKSAIFTGILLFTTTNKITFGDISEKLNSVEEQLKELDEELRVDWKEEYLKTLVASYLKDNFKEIGSITLPDIKLLNF